MEESDHDKYGRSVEDWLQNRKTVRGAQLIDCHLSCHLGPRDTDCRENNGSPDLLGKSWGFFPPRKNLNNPFKFGGFVNVTSLTVTVNIFSRGNFVPDWFWVYQPNNACEEFGFSKVKFNLLVFFLQTGVCHVKNLEMHPISFKMHLLKTYRAIFVCKKLKEATSNLWETSLCIGWILLGKFCPWKPPPTMPEAFRLGGNGRLQGLRFLLI